MGMKSIVDKILGTQAKQIAFSFFIVIFVGSLLLSLPISQSTTSQAEYLDHLFTSVSLVCVTGLFTEPVYMTYTTFGQIICMILMQIGGLSLMTLMSLSIYYLRNQVSLRNQYLVQSTINRTTNYDLKNFLKHMVLFTLTVEAVCSILVSIRLIPQYGVLKGIFSSIFLAISAFNNAGFDNLSASSLLAYQSDAIVLLPIAFSIIFAGLGFSVWYELRHMAKDYLKQEPKSLKLIYHRMSLHSRVVIIGTVSILIFGTLSTWLIEMDNVHSIGQMPWDDQLLNSFFQTVSMRTAGFATLDYSQTKFATNMLYILQMVIGGSPGGTAGGIKVTTLVIIFLYLRAEVRGATYISVFKRSLSSSILRRAVSVFFFYLTTLMIGWFLILLTNPSLDPFKVIFECVSALSTVGVSINLTTSLNRIGQIILMALMFLGRVGPLTVFMSLSLRQHAHKDIRYAKTDLLIG